MALKSRLRRALLIPSSSASSSASSTASNLDSPRTASVSSSTSTSETDLGGTLTAATTTTSANAPAPMITLTKTSSSSSRLERIMSWRSRGKRSHGLEPKSKYPGLKNGPHMEMLSAWEIKFGRTGDKRLSIISGVSPMASRQCSVDLEREEECES